MSASPEDWLLIRAAGGDACYLNLRRVVTVRLTDEAGQALAWVGFTAGQAPRHEVLALADEAGLRGELERRGWPLVSHDEEAEPVYLNLANVATLRLYRDEGRGEKAGVLTTAGVLAVTDPAALAALRAALASRVGGHGG